MVHGNVSTYTYTHFHLEFPNRLRWKSHFTNYVQLSECILPFILPTMFIILLIIIVTNHLYKDSMKIDQNQSRVYCKYGDGSAAFSLNWKWLKFMVICVGIWTFFRCPKWIWSNNKLTTEQSHNPERATKENNFQTKFGKDCLKNHQNFNFSRQNSHCNK